MGYLTHLMGYSGETLYYSMSKSEQLYFSSFQIFFKESKWFFLRPRKIKWFALRLMKLKWFTRVTQNVG